MKRTVRSQVGEVTLRERGIVTARIFADATIDTLHVKDYDAMVNYLCKSEAHVRIVDITGLKHITQGALDFLAKTSIDQKKTIAVAIVGTPASESLNLSFVIMDNKTDYPIRNFPDVLSAHQWARNEYRRYHMRIAS